MPSGRLTESAQRQGMTLLHAAFGRTGAADRTLVAAGANSAATACFSRSGGDNPRGKGEIRCARPLPPPLRSPLAHVCKQTAQFRFAKRALPFLISPLSVLVLRQYGGCRRGMGDQESGGLGCHPRFVGSRQRRCRQKLRTAASYIAAAHSLSRLPEAKCLHGLRANSDLSEQHNF